MSAASRLELAVAALGVVAAATGYALGAHVLEYLAVLLAVSGFSLALARVLSSR